MLLQTFNEGIVSVGSRVRIRDIDSGDREVYTLTRPSDADIRQNRISTLSPIGKALYGKQAGHVVNVHAPGGVFLMEIEAVEQASYPQQARAG